MKIVIIEDEKITARDLKRTIHTVEPDIEVAALLHSVEDAVEYFKTNTDADLIFSDIQLGDGLSFDIFKRTDNGIPVVFCTAYDTYFQEAFQATGIDYVLKPFTADSIGRALGKYKQLEKRFSQNKDDYKSLLGLLESKLYPPKTAVIIRHREKIIPLNFANIAVLFIDNGCTYACTFTQEKFLITENLEDLEKSFAPHFFRANRQYLVNRKAVKDASHFFNRKIVVNLTIPFKGQILIGKLKAALFVEWLSAN
jgi:two-component system, LytTR family, response regulator LytT